MTILRYLRHRFKRGLIPVLAYIAVTMLVTELAPAQRLLNQILGFLLLPVIAAYVVAMLRIRCPKCAQRLGVSAYSVLSLRHSHDEHCPHCGVRFDAVVAKL